MFIYLLSNFRALFLHSQVLLHSAFRPLFAGAARCKYLPYSSILAVFAMFAVYLFFGSVLLLLKLLVESFPILFHTIYFLMNEQMIFFSWKFVLGAIWRGLRIIRFLIFFFCFFALVGLIDRAFNN